MRTNVLFATDGRPAAAAAGELLRRLLDPGRVRVTILHADEFGNRLVADRYAAWVLDEAQEAMREAGIDATTLRLHEGPVASIEKVLAEDEHALTVLGAGNHSWLRGLVFGSVSTHLLHHAEAPVLVVHRAPIPAHGKLRVLVGVDGSPSVAAAASLLTTITAPARVDIQLCSVIEPAVLSVAAHPGASMSPSLLDDLFTERQEAAARDLTQMQARLDAGGFEARTTTVEGPVALALLDEVERLDAGLVVLGARGLGPIGRLTVGSVSAHVARHAPAALVAHAEDRIGRETEE
ncbi:MAG: universal stress protein [Actinomycetota bacterium]